MKTWVVDASVIAAAFFPEKHSRVAREVLVSGSLLLAPDLVYAEIASVVWKRCRRGEIHGDEASGILADMLDLPLQITPSEQLAGLALELALRTGRTAYDCLYVALALQKKVSMLSADQRLVNSFAAGPLKHHVLAIETVKES